jgi:hypothetical protein
MHFPNSEDVSVGDVFYKDGNNFVSNYTGAAVKDLLVSATMQRQAAFSFLSKSNFDSLLAPQLRLKPYKIVQQAWDFEKPCTHCGCIFLHSEAALFRLKCCNKGILLSSANTFPKLMPLPPHLEHLAVRKINHMTNSSSYYNGALQLGNTFLNYLFWEHTILNKSNTCPLPNRCYWGRQWEGRRLGKGSRKTRC